jgi:hypothetical protein
MGSTGLLDLSTVAFNTADVVSVGALVLAATAVIWGIRMAIKMVTAGQ